ncbi:hypothetical protein AB0C84_40380 [Actinomadura sp. NPDC048955]|uniref:hypothetical protein n=1 Tax=Actinomadura sp. NPDC048955 TaxID=3158228 RepID=UPI003408359C
MQLLPAARQLPGPPHSPPAPPPERPGPLYRPPADELVLLGAHGGAGVSTVVALLENHKVWDFGALPRQHLRTGRTVMGLAGRPLILLARGNVPSAALATAATRTLLHSGYPVTALIVVSDGAGPEPPEATARFRLLEPHLASGLLRMPFIPALRLVDQPAKVHLPRAAARSLTALRQLAPAQPAPQPTPQSAPTPTPQQGHR